MALDNIPVGDAIAAFIQANRTPDGTIENSSNLQFMWEGIMGIIYSDIKANAEVLPGTFANSAGAVSGEGKVT